jgi:hypothetical protein
MIAWLKVSISLCLLCHVFCSKNDYDYLKVTSEVELIHGPCDEKYSDPRNKSGSICGNINILNNHDVVSHRAPYVVSDFLLSMLSRNSTYVEIGAKSGVIAQCVSHFSNVLAAIEYNQRSCIELKRTGLKAICGDFFELNEQTMPVADLYYWWVISKLDIKFYKHLDYILKKLQVKRKVAMGFDLQETALGFHQEREILTWLTMRYPSTINRLCFNEGHKPRAKGIFVVAVFDVGLGVTERKISTNIIEDEPCTESKKRPLSPLDSITLGDLAPIALHLETLLTPEDTFVTVYQSSNISKFVYPLVANNKKNMPIEFLSSKWKGFPLASYYLIREKQI